MRKMKILQGTKECLTKKMLRLTNIHIYSPQKTEYRII